MLTSVPPFEPHPFLKNGHVMTIVSAFVPRRFDIPPAEARLFQVDVKASVPPQFRWFMRTTWKPR